MVCNEKYYNENSAQFSCTATLMAGRYEFSKKKTLINGKHICRLGSSFGFSSSNVSEKRPNK